MRYTASVSIMGKKHEATGESVLEAISNLGTVRLLPKTKSILTVSSKDTKRERVMSPIAMARLFNPSPLMRQVACKNTSLLFT